MWTVAVDALFEALCEGAEANPDAMDEDEGDFFFNQAEVSAGLDAAGHQRLAALEDRLQLPSAEEFSELLSGEGTEQQGRRPPKNQGCVSPGGVDADMEVS
jgi:hypothetical protein